MLFARWDPHDIPWTDLVDRTALPLRQTEAVGHDERLSERMRLGNAVLPKRSQRGCNGRGNCKP